MNELINKNYYPIHFTSFELVRDSGSMAYVAASTNKKYFLRVIKPAFYDTAVSGVEVQTFLQNKGFPVAPIISTNDGKQYITETRNDGDYLYVLYEYIEGAELQKGQVSEEAGELIGKLHSLMSGYTGKLSKHNKHFYIDRYINILHKKKYANVDEFEKYGDTLWAKIKDLPRRYCHGDMYHGNIYKTPNGKLYVLDFDTSCEGFPLYDLALICNMTDYFNYDEAGYQKTKMVFEKLLPQYQIHNEVTQTEINCFYGLIALYHFALQATVIEVHGIDCVDSKFLDKQLDWLYKWRRQCEMNNTTK